MTATTTTTRADALRSLADRVEAGADIRDSLWAAFTMIDADYSRINVLMGAGAYLSAVSAFTEAVLPGWEIVASTDRWAAAYPPRFKQQGGRVVQARSAPTEPAARLAAVLRALAVETDNAG